MSEDSYTWISTRDGSPTLWNNHLAEPFRNTRGAFTESWETFVQPALKFALAHPELRPLSVGEFGLGPGTNWILLNLAATNLKISVDYFAIEKDTRSFEIGKSKWQDPQTQNQIFEFLKTKLKDLDLHFQQSSSPPNLEIIKNPRISNDIASFYNSTEKANVWFHDPFGCEVNAEGYSLQTLNFLKPHWTKPFLGLSYTCQSQFQRNLTSLGFQVNAYEYESKIKRERLEFKL